MDCLIDKVTLDAWTISDILKNYQGKEVDYRELFDMAKGYDLSKPSNKVPIRLYVEMCSWIENKLGKFNLIKIGRNIGESTYKVMVSSNLANENSSPFEIMNALIVTAQKGVRDEQKRGWVVLNHDEQSILMRKTQVFNASIQLGMLDYLVRKSKVMGVKVNLVAEIAKGAEFDEYLITWL